MADEKAPMPWGLQGLRPGSLQDVSKQKLQAFSVGRMGTV